MAERMSLSSEPMSTERPANKCPYLAGRQHLGTYHTAPSRENRCYARPTPEKPHHHVSRDRQELLCLCSAPVYERCPNFRSARLQAIEPPSYGGTARHPDPEAGHETPSVRFKRVKRRQRRPLLSSWWKRNRRAFLISVVFLLTSAFLLLASSYLLPALSGAGDGS